MAIKISLDALTLINLALRLGLTGAALYQAAKEISQMDTDDLSIFIDHAEAKLSVEIEKVKARQ